MESERYLLNYLGLEVGSIRHIQGLDTAYWEFLRVGTTLDIFQNIISIPYFQYGVLVFWIRRIEIYSSVVFDALDAQAAQSSFHKRSHDNQDPPNNRKGENKKKSRKDVSEPSSRSSRRHRSPVVIVQDDTPAISMVRIKVEEYVMKAEEYVLKAEEYVLKAEEFVMRNIQCQQFIYSQLSLDYDNQMTNKSFFEYTRFEAKDLRDTLLKHMSFVKKLIAKRARHQRQYDRRVNKTQLHMQEGEVDMSKALNADWVVIENIKPVNDKEPMAAVQMNAKYNVLANGQQHAEQLDFNNKGGVEQDVELYQVKSPLLDAELFKTKDMITQEV
ncbi:hypothetical protein Tco_1047336 [Tanacetum coccineum]